MREHGEFELLAISDADEPEDTIRMAMARAHFGGVLLAFVPDDGGEGSGWFGTSNTPDGRATRPELLLFQGSLSARMKQASSYISGELDVPLEDVNIVGNWRQGNSSEVPPPIQALRVYLEFPPYPWLDTAALGLNMGPHYDTVELADWDYGTDGESATYVFEFSNRPQR